MRAAAWLLVLAACDPVWGVDVRVRHPGRVPVEVSGGLTLATAKAYASAGADRLSIGALTHSAPAIDISLEFR